MKKTLIFIFIVSCSTVIASEYDYIYKGARPMGMGGAFTAVSDDVNALFYNPAGLNRIKPGDSEVVVLNPNVALNNSAMNVINKISGTLTKNPITTLTPYIGQNMHIDVATSMPYWTKRNFAVALMLPNIRNNTTLRRNVATEAVESVVADAGLLFGFAHGFLQDRLAVGADIKFLVRGAGGTTFDAVQLYTKKAVSFKDIGGYGFGVDGDLGAIYTFNKVAFFVPSVGISINNIVGTTFPTRLDSSNRSVPGAYKLHRNLGIGSKFEMPMGAHFTKWIVAFDVDNIGFSGSFFKKVHLGTEALLLDFFGLRGGVNQGYLTFGLTLNIPVVKVDFYTYGEELGDSAGSKGDRRIGIQLSFGW